MATSTIKALIMQDFEGGKSTSRKSGIKNSQFTVQSFDFRKQPDQMSVLPGPTREDAGVVKDLILNEVMAPNGVIYAFGNSGYFYKRTTTGVWSVEGKLSAGTFGEDYRRDTDSIYLTGSKTVSLYNPVIGTGTPTLIPDKYASSVSTYDNSTQAGFNVSANQSGSSLTTSILVATSPLNESQTSRRYFQTDIEPLNKISIYVVNKGTGNWTLTLHDGLNNVLGTSTVANANLINHQFNDFVFTTAPNGQVRVLPAPNARTYHIHVTSTVADGTTSSTATNDLSSCDLEIWADRLVVTNNALHPLVRFQQFECFGNANYLSVWEPNSDPPTNAEWLRHALVFPMEYEVCGLAVQNEFIVIAAGKTSTTSTTPQQGILFFWDGVSTTYNYFVEIPEGTPQAITCYKNVVYYYAGGAWWGLASATTQPVKMRTLPGSQTEFSGAVNPITMYPGIATVRRGVQLFGYPGSTNNTGIQYGVYSWGAVDKNYPDSFGLSYMISTGSQFFSAQNNLQIGMTQAFDDILHTSWQDSLNGGFGIDVVTNSSNPAPYALWQGMVFDNGYVSKMKTALYIEAYYSIPSGATVTLGYAIDQGNFVRSPAYSTTNLWNNGQLGANYCRFDVTTGNVGRFHEFQPQLEVTCDNTVTVAPIIYMISLVFDTNATEQLI